MKKIYYFLFLLIGTLSMTSCLKDENNYVDSEVWRLDNEAFFNRMKDSIDPVTKEPYFKRIVAEDYPAYEVLYHEITPGKEDGRIPYYNSTVQVNYAGHLYDRDTNFDEATGAEFRVNGVVAGWTWALQNMKEGAKWEIIVPWQLGYGATGSTNSSGIYDGVVPPYSTMVFTIELVKILKWETGTN